MEYEKETTIYLPETELLIDAVPEVMGGNGATARAYAGPGDPSAVAALCMLWDGTTSSIAIGDSQHPSAEGTRDPIPRDQLLAGER